MDKLDINKFVRDELEHTAEKIDALKNIIYILVFIMIIFLVSIIIFAISGPNWIIWLAIFGLLGFTFKTALDLESEIKYIIQTKNFFAEYEEKHEAKSTKKL
jgi:c-di-AMP phosphodiesterase-like protein